MFSLVEHFKWRGAEDLGRVANENSTVEGHFK